MNFERSHLILRQSIVYDQVMLGSRLHLSVSHPQRCWATQKWSTDLQANADTVAQDVDNLDGEFADGPLGKCSTAPQAVRDFLVQRPSDGALLYQELPMCASQQLHGGALGESLLQRGWR